ncbi:hypothetical protein [Wolbachia endosymbiont (group A) of Beris morrisii]
MTPICCKLTFTLWLYYLAAILNGYVPRHWDPVFHAISQRHLFEYKTTTFTLTSSVCFLQ